MGMETEQEEVEEKLLCQDCWGNPEEAIYKCPECEGLVCKRHAKFTDGRCPFYANHSPKLESL